MSHARMTSDHEVKDRTASSLNRRNLLSQAGILASATTIGVSAAVAQPQPPESVSQSRRTAPEPGGLRKGMIGFILAHEQFTVPDLLRFGAQASHAGFELLATSDHFQPWQANEAHSGAAWVTIGALGDRAPNVWMGTAVTCPTLRYNPAIVAEAFATLSHLYPGRVFLGVGSGEA